MPSSPATERTLLKWVNTFPLDSKVESLADLSDGLVFSKMLEDFDPVYAVHNLENNIGPSKWLAKKKSLEAVYKSLLRYIQNYCTAHVDPATLESPDFNAIAEYDDEQQTVKLLEFFLLAAVHGTKNLEYVGTIQTLLDKTDQVEIASILQGMTTGKPSEIAPNVTDASLPPKLTHNRDLALEAGYAKVSAENEVLKKTCADYVTRLEHLHENYGQLLTHSKEADRELEAFRGSNDDNRADYINNLKNTIREQNDIIASQEQQIDSDRVIKERDQRELIRLRGIAERVEQLEDKVAELKTENATLSKRANMVDHFKTKLEQQKIIEDNNSTLRRRVDVLEGNQVDYDKVHEENSKFQKTIREYTKKFEAYEGEHVELTSQKKLLEEELRMRDAEINSLQARQQHDEDFIQSLQEQIRTNTAGPLSPDSPSARPAGLSLEEELEQSQDSGSNYALEISRLRAENQLLKSSAAGTTNATLRSDLEEAEKIRRRLEENIRDLTEKHAIGQMQLNAMLSNSSGEKGEAVMATRKLYLEANQELSTVKTKLAEIQAELSSRDRDLLAARADLAAIDQEEMDALEDLKATNEIITSSFQNDLLILQNKHKALTIDHEQQKSQFIDVLLSKDRLMKDLAAFKERFQINGDDDYQKAQSKGIVEEVNARKALEEQIKTQDAIIQGLQRRLKNAEEGGPDAQKAANESIIKNLTRENALIATAWYDLTSRLQSNHVVLQRRQDAPRSWLNKQRQFVNATPRR